VLHYAKTAIRISPDEDCSTRARLGGSSTSKMATIVLRRGPYNGKGKGKHSSSKTGGRRGTVRSWSLYLLKLRSAKKDDYPPSSPRAGLCSKEGKEVVWRYHRRCTKSYGDAE